MPVLGDVVAVLSCTVDTHGIGQVLDCTGLQQDVPRVDAGSWPGRDIKDHIIKPMITLISKISGPYRKAQVIADLWQDLPSFKFYQRTLLAHIKKLIFIGHPKEVPFVVGCDFSLWSDPEQPVIIIAAFVDN